MTIEQFQDYEKQLAELQGRVRFAGFYDVPIYPFQVFFLCGKFDWVELKTIFMEKGWSEPVADHFAFGITKHTFNCYSFHETKFVLCMEKMALTAQEHSAVAHECLHGVINLFSGIGLHLHQNSQEAFTYFHDDLVETWYQIQHDAIQEFIKDPEIILSKHESGNQ